MSLPQGFCMTAHTMGNSLCSASHTCTHPVTHRDTCSLTQSDLLSRAHSHKHTRGLRHSDQQPRPPRSLAQALPGQGSAPLGACVTLWTPGEAAGSLRRWWGQRELGGSSSDLRPGGARLSAASQSQGTSSLSVGRPAVGNGAHLQLMEEAGPQRRSPWRVDGHSPLTGPTHVLQVPRTPGRLSSSPPSRAAA